MQEHRLDSLHVYQSAMSIGEECWKLVSEWDKFAKQTLGNQLARAADSIAANIAEGYGRYSYKENKMFCYYARGSLYETRTWLQKAFARGFIQAELFHELDVEIQRCGKMLNAYIRSIGQTTR